MMRVRYEASTNTQYREWLDFNMSGLRCSIPFIKSNLFEPKKAQSVSVESSNHNFKTIDNTTSTFNAVKILSLFQDMDFQFITKGLRKLEGIPGCYFPHSRPDTPQDLRVRNRQKCETHPEVKQEIHIPHLKVNKKHFMKKKIVNTKGPPQKIFTNFLSIKCSCPHLISL